MCTNLSTLPPVADNSYDIELKDTGSVVNRTDKMTTEALPEPALLQTPAACFPGPFTLFYFQTTAEIRG